MFKKKILLAFALSITILSLGACQKKDLSNNQVKDEVNIMEDNESSDILDDDDLSADTNSEEVSTQEESESTASQSLSDIVNKIYEIKPSGLKTMDLELDLTNPDSVTYNTGLKDASKIKEAIVSEAMITSQAYSMVLVRVNDIKDTETVAKEMLEGINPAKWICVSADDLQIVTVDDLILLIMVAPQLSDTVTSQEIVDAFAQVSGKDFDLSLTK